jgi:hypothetical protein
MAIDRFTPGLCCVCRGVEVGIGIRKNRRVMWVCGDPTHLEIALRSDTVDPYFQKMEREAAITGGGDAMGQFLDDRGFGSAFDGMPPEVWAEAALAFADGYRRKLVELVNSGAAPF